MMVSAGTTVDAMKPGGPEPSGSLPSPPRSHRHRYVPLGWYLLGAYAVTTLFVVAQLRAWPGAAYWAASISAAAQACGAVLSPRMRLRRDQWLTPGNIALAVWILHLVVLPLALVAYGPRRGPLRELPAAETVNVAILLEVLAYAAFSAFFARRGGAETKVINPRVRRVPMPLVLGCLAIGLIGVALLFRTPEAAIAYYSGRPELVRPGGSTTLAEGASALMRPFLGVGGILLLQRLPRNSSSSGRLWNGFTLLTITLIFLGYSGYHYNRAAFTTALIAFVAALSVAMRRIGLPALLGMVVAATIVAVQIGTYRVVYIGTEGGRLTTYQVGLANYRPDLLQELEVYMGAPQFTALSVQATGNGTDLAGPMPLAGSVLSPIPLLGKGFREKNTTTLYNQAIYGGGWVRDQHPPLAAELFWGLGVLGIILGFALFGRAVALIDRYFAAENDLIVNYAATYLGVTLAFAIAGGLAVLSQTLLYFILPMLPLLLFLRGGIAPRQAIGGEPACA